MRGKWIGPGNLSLGSRMICPGEPVEMADDAYLDLVSDPCGADRAGMFENVALDSDPPKPAMEAAPKLVTVKRKAKE